MNSPFMLARLGMLVVALAVVGLIVGLFFIEGKQGANSTNQTNQNQESKELQSISDLIKDGSEDDLIIRVNEITNVPRSAPYILKVNQIKDKISLFRELVRREDKLSQETVGTVKRGLLGSLLQLHTENLNERVDDVEARKDLVMTARQMINNAGKEVGKDAHITLTAVSILEILDDTVTEDEVKNAKSTIADLIRRYPNDKEPVVALYTLMTEAVDLNDYDNTIEMLQTINDHCLKSKNEEIRTIGYGNVGRLLLLKHDIIDLRGALTLYEGDDTTKILANIDRLFAEDYTISVPFAQVLALLATRMEQWNRNDAALHLYRLLVDRIGENKTYEKIVPELNSGIKRLSAKGKPANFPDIESGKYYMVVYLNSSELSKTSGTAMADFQVISENRDVSVIFVSVAEDARPFRDHLASRGLSNLKLVHDPNRQSAYLELFPAKFLPSVIIVGKDGVVVDVNVNVPRIEDFLREITEMN